MLLLINGNSMEWPSVWVKRQKTTCHDGSKSSAFARNLIEHKATDACRVASRPLPVSKKRQHAIFISYQENVFAWIDRYIGHS